MGVAWQIARKDLRLRLRDRSAFIVGILAPLGLAVIFSFVLSGVSESGFHPSYGVVVEDDGPVAGAFVGVLESLEDDDLFDLDTVSGRATAAEAVDTGDLDAVWIVPAGFSEAVASGSAAQLDVLGFVDSPTSTAVAGAIAEGFGAELESVQLAVATAIAAAGSDGAGLDIAALSDRAQTTEPPIRVVDSQAADRQLDLTTFFVAGMAVFFLFFTVQFGVNGLLEERLDGTMARLLAAPIRPAVIVIGKALVSVVLGLVSMAVLIGASSLLLGAHWGNPVGVALLVVAAVLSAVGVMAIVAAFSRTPEGAGNLQSILAVGLGMLGGIFFPASLGTGWLARLSYVSPHRWFLLGLGDLAGGGGLGVIGAPLAGLLTFGVVTSALAYARLRKGLAR